jgi:hypothetical protein
LLEAQEKRLIFERGIEKRIALRRLSRESEVRENGTPGKGNVHGMRLVRLYGGREV